MTNGSNYRLRRDFRSPVRPQSTDSGPSARLLGNNSLMSVVIIVISLLHHDELWLPAWQCFKVSQGLRPTLACHKFGLQRFPSQLISFMLQHQQHFLHVTLPSGSNNPSLSCSTFCPPPTCLTSFSPHLASREISERNRVRNYANDHEQLFSPSNNFSRVFHAEKILQTDELNETQKL